MNKKFCFVVFLSLMVFVLGTTGVMAAEKTYNLKMATVVSAPHPWIEAGEFMAKEVEAKTNGKVKINLYPSSTLGNDQATIDEMRMGTIDFVIGGVSPATAFVPEFQVFSLPYLFRDYDQFNNALAADGKIFPHFQKVYKDRKLGLMLLSLCGGGTRNVSNNIRPVVKPEDVDGMKMRIPGSPVVTKIWKTAGALPIPMPWNEIYSAIQTGVVNTFESTISGYFGSKYFEVAKYHSKTEHQFMVSHISASEMTWKKLPEEHRKIIMDVADEAGKMVTRKGLEFDEKLLAEMIEKNGVQVNEVDKEAFVNLFIPLQDELAAELKSSDILQLIREVK